MTAPHPNGATALTDETYIESVPEPANTPAQLAPPHQEWFAETVEYWQRALGLDDYRIAVAVNHPHPMTGYQGQCVKADDDREVLIRIADFRTLEGASLPFGEAFANYELTIIHELLHVVLWELGDTSQRRFLDFTSAGQQEHNRHLEQAINRLAGTLYALKTALPGNPVSPGWVRVTIHP